MKPSNSFSLESVKKELQSNLTFMQDDYYKVNQASKQKMSYDFATMAKNISKAKLHARMDSSFVINQHTSVKSLRIQDKKLEEPISEKEYFNTQHWNEVKETISSLILEEQIRCENVQSLVVKDLSMI
jgi:hypothetical protein